VGGGGGGGGGVFVWGGGLCGVLGWRCFCVVGGVFFWGGGGGWCGWLGCFGRANGRTEKALTWVFLPEIGRGNCREPPRLPATGGSSQSAESTALGVKKKKKRGDLERGTGDKRHKGLLGREGRSDGNFFI